MPKKTPSQAHFPKLSFPISKPPTTIPSSRIASQTTHFPDITPSLAYTAKTGIPIPKTPLKFPKPPTHDPTTASHIVKPIPYQPRIIARFPRPPPFRPPPSSILRTPPPLRTGLEYLSQISQLRSGSGERHCPRGLTQYPRPKPPPKHSPSLSSPYSSQ